MILFIPSWYSGTDDWDSERQYWYRDQQTRVDDTLARLRISRHAGEKVGLLNLAYSPGLRRLLLSEGVQETELWSAFDEMQGICLTECIPVRFRDLDWPKGIEWVYSPFLIWGYREEKPVARIEFGQDGEMMETDMYAGGEPALRYEWDDRGFASRVTRYQKGKAQYRDYLDSAGAIQFRETLPGGEVQVSRNAHYPFRQSRYSGMKEMIAEVLAGKLAELGQEDILIVSADERHNDLFLTDGRNAKVLLSLGGSGRESGYSFRRKDLFRADGICCDSQWTAGRLLDHCPELSGKLLVEPPMDARMTPGISSEKKEEYLFLPADGVADEVLARSLELMETVLKENESVVLVIAASSYSQTSEQVRTGLRERVARLSAIRLPAEEEDLGENRVLQEEERTEETPRMMLATYRDTSELESLLLNVRLILELAEEPSERLQIMGIGMGIPQILNRTSRYVDHMREGYQLHSLEELPQAVAYYLNDLNHWNEAMLCCMQKVEIYSGESMVRRWKRLARGEGDAL